MISTNQFKNGNHIEVEGVVFKILEFQHVKPGKGGAFVRTRLRRASDGNVIDRTFRAGEKFNLVRSEARRMQYLYTDGADAHFMDAASFEQIVIPESVVADALRWILPSTEVDVLFLDDSPADLQLPTAVDLQVTETEPGVRGDTASGYGRDQARDARDRRPDSGAAVRQRRRARACRHAQRRLHVARVSAVGTAHDERRIATPVRRMASSAVRPSARSTSTTSPASR